VASNSLPSSGTASRPPKYCRQKGKNRSDPVYVRIDGRKIVLGTYGSEESRQRYAELIGSTKDEKPRPVTDPTMAVVMAAFLEHAQVYYRQPNDKPGREYEMIRDTLQFVRKNCGARPAKDFGPKRLKEIREAMIEADHSRRYINKNIERIRRMFRWAVAEELIPAAVHTALSTVDGLKRGRTEAREAAPVMPVDDGHVYKPHSNTCPKWWPIWCVSSGLRRCAPASSCM
jgi:hypothetical protein